MEGRRKGRLKQPLSLPAEISPNKKELLFATSLCAYGSVEPTINTGHSWNYQEDGMNVGENQII